jgi:hypothetical protein
VSTPLGSSANVLCDNPSSGGKLLHILSEITLLILVDDENLTVLLTTQWLFTLYGSSVLMISSCAERVTADVCVYSQLQLAAVSSLLLGSFEGNGWVGEGVHMYMRDLYTRAQVAAIWCTCIRILICVIEP